jgi:mevalonate kinase
MTLRASACGKIILFGEHAVVYDYPAVAIPVRSLRATAEWEPGAAPVRISAPDIRLDAALADLPAEHPLADCLRRAAAAFGADVSGGTLTVRSEIPVAAGLGSGAAVSTAIVRALAEAAGKQPTPAEISAIVFEVERLHHGTPSGVDNTVIAYERPIWFRRGCDPVPLAVGAPLRFVIADSGIRSSTRAAVGGVRARRDEAAQRYDSLFRRIGELAEAGRAALAAGDGGRLGAAMNENQDLLQAIEVSMPALDRLVEAARGAGAQGAKLTGAGLGGNTIALVESARSPAVESALRGAGAANVFSTVLEP